MLPKQHNNNNKTALTYYSHGKTIMLRTRLVSFSVGFATASAIGFYKLRGDIEKSTQILVHQVKDAEKRLQFLEGEMDKMKTKA